MASNPDIQTVAQENKAYRKTTIRTPDYVWKAVRMAAFERETDAQTIWVEAVLRYLKLKSAKSA